MFICAKLCVCVFILKLMYSAAGGGHSPYRQKVFFPNNIIILKLLKIIIIKNESEIRILSWLQDKTRKKKKKKRTLVLEHELTALHFLRPLCLDVFVESCPGSSQREFLQSSSHGQVLSITYTRLQI